MLFLWLLFSSDSCSRPLFLKQWTFLEGFMRLQATPAFEWFAALTVEGLLFFGLSYINISLGYLSLWLNRKIKLIGLCAEVGASPSLEFSDSHLSQGCCEFLITDPYSIELSQSCYLYPDLLNRLRWKHLLQTLHRHLSIAQYYVSKHCLFISAPLSHSPHLLHLLYLLFSILFRISTVFNRYLNCLLYFDFLHRFFLINHSSHWCLILLLDTLDSHRNVLLITISIRLGEGFLLGLLLTAVTEPAGNQLKLVHEAADGDLFLLGKAHVCGVTQHHLGLKVRWEKVELGDSCELAVFPWG